MKILIIGGSGLIGANVTSKLKNTGHEVIAGSPSTGIDVLTGEGLAAAMKGTDVVIDLSNSPSFEDGPAMNFFRKAGENLVIAEKAAGVRHHVILSIVGTDTMQNIGYLRAKKMQEDIIKASGIPYTIIHSTQFYEFVPTLIAVASDNDQVHLSTIEFQPIAAEDVALYVTKIALDPAGNTTIQIAGPELAGLADFAERFLKAKGDPRVVVPNERNEYIFNVVPRSALVPHGDFDAGTIHFDDWVRA